jgi:hypothetical protein
MEKQELEELILRWKEGKSKSPSRMDRPLTYQLYNELLKPKMRRSEKDCTCLDRDSDYKVTRHIEANYADLVKEPLPISSNVKVELEGMTKPKTTKKKTTRKRTTKKKNEGTKPNTSSASS